MKKTVLCQMIQYNISTQLKSRTVIPLRASVGLGVMAVMVYSTFSKV